jgi:aspartate kinase
VIEKMFSVVKVGGSILKSAEDYVKTAAELRKLVEEGERFIVVVSAAKGVTDNLLKYLNSSNKAIEEVEEFYVNVAREIGGSKLVKRVEEELSGVLNTHIKYSLLSPVVYDHVLSIGERLSKIILHGALDLVGVNSVELDARDFILTNNIHGDAEIDLEKTAPRVGKLREFISEGVIPIIEGFVGLSPDGFVTTLGRGGSDYTATAIAKILGLEKVYLVTEVPGVYVADPSIIKRVEIVPRLSYREAYEASLHGVKKFNSKTFKVLLGSKGIRVYVGEWGKFLTVIDDSSEGEGPKMIATSRDESHIRVTVIGEGIYRAKYVAKVVNSLRDLGERPLGLNVSYPRPSITLLFEDEKGANEAVLTLYKGLLKGGDT